MTVVCWDGTTLAADRRATMGGHTFPITKIFRIRDVLVGFSGAADRIGSFRRWVEFGCDDRSYPPNPENDCVVMVMLHRDGRIERYEDQPFPIVVEDTVHATGSGRDYARAAMHLGCDAQKAVEVACLFDENCGNGIDVLRFEGVS